MPTYVTRPRAWHEEPAPQPLPHPTVYASEPVNTGLLSKDGAPIYRLPEPLGFLKPARSS